MTDSDELIFTHIDLQSQGSVEGFEPQCRSVYWLCERIGIANHHLDLSVDGEIHLRVGEESCVVDISRVLPNEWGKPSVLEEIISSYAALLTKDYLGRVERLSVLTSGQKPDPSMQDFTQHVLYSAHRQNLWSHVLDYCSPATTFN